MNSLDPVREVEILAHTINVFGFRQLAQERPHVVIIVIADDTEMSTVIRPGVSILLCWDIVADLNLMINIANVVLPYVIVYDFDIDVLCAVFIRLVLPTLVEEISIIRGPTSVVSLLDLLEGNPDGDLRVAVPVDVPCAIWLDLRLSVGPDVAENAFDFNGVADCLEIFVPTLAVECDDIEVVGGLEESIDTLNHLRLAVD